MPAPSSEAITQGLLASIARTEQTLQTTERALEACAAQLEAKNAECAELRAKLGEVSPLDLPEVPANGAVSAVPNGTKESRLDG